MGKPETVYVWQNGMVMVFDAEGEQVGELQGPLEEVEERVAYMVPPGRWQYRAWPGGETAPATAPATTTLAGDVAGAAGVRVFDRGEYTLARMPEWAGSHHHWWHYQNKRNPSRGAMVRPGLRGGWEVGLARDEGLVAKVKAVAPPLVSQGLGRAEAHALARAWVAVDGPPD